MTKWFTSCDDFDQLLEECLELPIKKDSETILGLSEKEHGEQLATPMLEADKAREYKEKHFVSKVWTNSLLSNEGPPEQRTVEGRITASKDVRIFTPGSVNMFCYMARGNKN